MRSTPNSHTRLAGRRTGRAAREMPESAKRLDEIERVGVFVRHDVGARGNAMADKRRHPSIRCCAPAPSTARIHQIFGQIDVFLIAYRACRERTMPWLSCSTDSSGTLRRSIGIVAPRKHVGGGFSPSKPHIGRWATPASWLYSLKGNTAISASVSIRRSMTVSISVSSQKSSASKKYR